MEWWHDWWISVARFFGYDEWIWGSAADWFAAIGTVGALALGLALYRGEQLRRRRVDADLFVTRAGITQSESSRDGFRYVLHVRANNRGPNPVSEVVLLVRHPTKRRQMLTFGYLITEASSDAGSPLDGGAIGPGESAQIEREVRRGTRHRDCYIKFTDWSGRTWIRTFEAGTKYRSTAHFHRTFMPLSDYPEYKDDVPERRRWRYGPKER